MRHPLILETPERLPDGMGGHRTQWRVLGTLWAHMQAASAREARGEVGASALARWRLVVPGARAGDPRRPRPGQRLRMGSRLFTVEAVVEADGAGRRLTVWTREEEGRA